MNTLRIDKLREECEVEQYHFGIQDVCEEGLSEQPAI